MKKKLSRDRKLVLKVETLHSMTAAAASDDYDGDGMAPNPSQESYCPRCKPDMTCSTYN